MSDYVEKANQYIADVLAGRIPTNKWTQAACLRQQDDLARDWEYVFSDEAASIPCEFLESLTHVAGEKGGEKFHLEPWECFFVCTLFGWRHKNNLRLRRFRRSFVMCGKGNGKSFISSGLSLFMLCCDGESGSQVISAARSTDQARVVYDVSRQQVLSNEELASTFGLKAMKKAIEHEATGSVMWPCSSQGKGVAGLLPYFVSNDETWAHRDRVLTDELQRGCAKRSNSLISTITHAGDNLGSVGKEQSDVACAILSKELQDDKTFCCIWSGEGYAWTDRQGWRAANPNWDVSVNPDELAAACALAQKVPTMQAVFRSHNLCEWLNADISWIDPARLDKCRDANLRMEDLKYWREGEPGFHANSKTYRPFVLGLDAASRQDICSVVWVCIGYVAGDEREHYFAFSQNYLPDSAVQNSPVSQYRKWAAQKQIFVHPGETLSLEAIQMDILAQYRRHLGYGAMHNADGFNISAAAYDSWQAAQLSDNLKLAGILAVEFAKTAKMYSPVMDFLSALILEGRFHLAKRDEVLFWALTNVHCHRDKNENLFPNKVDPTRKIDPAIALLYSLKCAMADSGKYVKDDSNAAPRILVLDAPQDLKKFNYGPGVVRRAD
jgi:phage terminase large subunit-like protein